jgi:threonine aldolase
MRWKLLTPDMSIPTETMSGPLKAADTIREVFETDCDVFFNRELAHKIEYRCKQAEQLASNMRCISAPWVAMLENDVWKNYAMHANLCAQKLSSELTKLDCMELIAPTESNGVFINMQADTRG